MAGAAGAACREPVSRWNLRAAGRVRAGPGGDPTGQEAAARGFRRGLRAKVVRGAGAAVAGEGAGGAGGSASGRRREGRGEAAGGLAEAGERGEGAVVGQPWDPHVGSSPGEDGNRELAVFVKGKKTP